MNFPPIPGVVDALTCSVRVVLGDMPEDADDFGVWHEGTRVIRLNKNHPRWQQWQTLYHELTHAALSDSGVDEILSNEQLEAICDAVASARFRERFSGYCP